LNCPVKISIHQGLTSFAKKKFRLLFREVQLKILVILTFSLLLILEGCKKSEEVTGSEAGTGLAVPLNIGNFWIYKTRRTYNNNSYTYFDTMRVVEYDSAGKLYKIISTSQDVLSNGYYQNTKSGLCLGSQLIFKYPGLSGDTSYSKGKIQFIDKDGIYVYYKLKTYNIGQYDDWSIYQEIEENYIKPNVGITQSHWATNTRNNTIIQQKSVHLESYSVK